MSDKKGDISSLKLVGGRICLDFMNTVHCRGCIDFGEYFNSFQDLVAWSRHVGTITNSEAKTLSLKATKYPSKAQSAHSCAIELREITYSIFSSIAEGKSPAGKDLGVFNN